MHCIARKHRIGKARRTKKTTFSFSPTIKYTHKEIYILSFFFFWLRLDNNIIVVVLSSSYHNISTNNNRLLIMLLLLYVVLLKRMGCGMCTTVAICGTTNREENTRQGTDSRSEAPLCQPAPCQQSGASVQPTSAVRPAGLHRNVTHQSQRGSAGRRPWAHLMVWWNTQPSQNQGVWSRSQRQRQVPGNAERGTKMTRSLAQRVPAYWRTQLPRGNH